MPVQKKGSAAMKDVNEAFARNDGEVRRDGELSVQAVGIPVRALCGLVAAAILAFGAYLVAIGHSPGRWLVSLMFALVSAPFAAIARFGWRVPVIDPVASKRFRELADPARPLTEDDFKSTTTEAEQGIDSIAASSSEAPGRERPRRAAAKPDSRG